MKTSSDSLRYYLTQINEAENNESVLESIDDLIRKDRRVRESIDDEFYAVMLRKVKSLMATSGGASSSSSAAELSLVLKCVKNSAGAFRDRFSALERDLYELLVDRIGFDKLDDAAVDASPYNTHVYLFQYIFNLIQGNKEAYETNMEKWSLICFSILNRPNLKQEFYDLSAMILIYGCVEKKTSTISPIPNLLDTAYLERLDVTAYTYLLDRLCSILVAKNYDFDDLIEHEQMHFWTYKYLDFYFEHIYFYHLVDGGRDELLSANFSSLLDYKIIKLDSSRDNKVRKYLNQSSLDFMMKHFVAASSDLMQQPNDEESLRKTRLIANTIADLLTFQEGLLDRDEIESNVRFAQNNAAFVAHVCELFKRVHSEPSAAWKTSRKEETRTGSSSIKCELVRLIGILVFENERNQNYLIENRVTFVLSENLDVDVENPFLREWSIVALRHILCAHDRR